ncbi:hypothetical protein Tco_0593536 [Tanacetum coccineum]
MIPITPTIIESSSQPQKTQKPRKPKRKDTQVPQLSGPTKHVADEAVHKELGDSLVRAATTASSLELEQDSGGGPRCQETMRDTIAQTRFENVSKLSNDSLLARGNTLQSDKDRLKRNELMELCTTLQKKVLDLEKTKTTQANEIASLKRRVKKLEQKKRSRTHRLKRLRKVGAIARVESSDEDITLVNDDADKEMFDVDALNGEEVFVAEQNENVVEEIVDAAQATPNESSSLGTTSGGGPKRQETIGDTIAQTRFENVSKLSNDSLLARGNTLQSDEDRLKLIELMELCTNLQKKVLDLEKIKTTQANEIASLKKRVKKLEQKKRSRTYELKRLRKVGATARVESSGDEENLGEDASKQERRINAIDADEDITLVSVQDDTDKEMFDVGTLNGKEVFVVGKNENVVEEVVDAAQVSIAATTVTITTEEITLAQALADLNSTKPKAKGIAFREPGESTTTIFSQQLQDKGLSQDKGKGILVEPEKPLKKKDQLKLDEEIALKLQAKIDEEEIIARAEEEKIDEANIALTEEWDDIQAKIEADHEMA